MALPANIIQGTTAGHLAHHGELHVAAGMGLPTTVTEGSEQHGEHHAVLKSWYDAAHPAVPLLAVADPASHELAHEALHAWRNGLSLPAMAGVFARLSGNDTSTSNGSAPIGWALDNPEAKMVSTMILWQQWEPTDNAFSTTIDNNLRAALGDAHAQGYSLVIRVMCGTDSPIGHPSDVTHASWLFGHPTRPVGRVLVYDNEQANAGDQIYVPDWITPSSYGNLRFFFNRMMSHLAAILNEACPHDSSHTRARHTAFVPASLATESGSEMTLGYGSSTTKPPGSDLTFAQHNRASWDAVASQATCRSRTEQAWKDDSDELAMILPPEVRIGVAGGHLFNDGHAGADRIIEYVRDRYGRRIVGMRTDLRPAYWSDPATWAAPIDYMDRAATIGALGEPCTIGFQTAGTSQISTPQQFVDAVENALLRWPDLAFIETHTAAFTSGTTATTAALGGWPGATSHTVKTYLLTHASSVQSRL